MDEWLINIEERKYKYYYSNLLEEGVDVLLGLDTDQYLIVADSRLEQEYVNFIVYELRKHKKCDILSLNILEKNKNISTLNYILEKCSQFNLSNKSTIVGIGGGVIGDVTGLCAGLLYRGIKFVVIPTTIMAAGDSVISLKQAVNSETCKNGIGVYFTTEFVLTLYPLFKTLSKRLYISGVAETIKNLLCISPEKIGSFKKQFERGLTCSDTEVRFIVQNSIEDKMKVLHSDWKEKKEGLILEYGHTIAHAIEMVTNGSVFHGEGVAFGMLVMAELGYVLGTISKDEYQLHYDFLRMIGVFPYLSGICEVNTDKILDQMNYDNKRGYLNTNKNEYAMVLLDGIGKCKKTNGINLVTIPRESVLVCINRVKEFLISYMDKITEDESIKSKHS